MNNSLQTKMASARPLVMGVLNVTPDSFSDGNKYNRLDKVLYQVQQWVNNGVDIIDVGGESTRPNAHFVPVEQELNRIVPVIEAIIKEFDVPISVDTYKPEVMKEALDLGVSMINDVKALQEPGSIDVLKNSNAYVCLMHMKGCPRTMQNTPFYDNILHQLKLFFESRIQECQRHQISNNRMIIDPGFGFGKNLDHNMTLLANLGQLKAIGLPILIGLSNKSMLGELTGKLVGQRGNASIIASLLAVFEGAKIVRVHDVEPMQEALSIVHEYYKYKLEVD
jgi:dihydropteroate synthase